MTTSNSRRNRIRRLCQLTKTAEPEVAEMLRRDLTALSATIRAMIDEMLDMVEQLPTDVTLIDMRKIRAIRKSVDTLRRNVDMQVAQIEARARANPTLP